MEYHEETRDNFAAAWSEVQKIGEEYMDRIQAAEDAETAQQLQGEAQAKMVDAVTEAEVEVSEYNEIATRMGQDPQFAERIREKTEQQ